MSSIEDRIAALSPEQRARLAKYPTSMLERMVGALEAFAAAEREPAPSSPAPKPAHGRPIVRGLGHRGSDDDGSSWTL